MDSIPPLVLPLWGASIVALIVSLAVIMAAKPHPAPRGIPAFLLPFAIPLALSATITLLVTGIGSVLLVARGVLDAGVHREPGQVTAGMGAAIAIALLLSLAVLLGSALKASQPGDDAHPH